MVMVLAEVVINSDICPIASENLASTRRYSEPTFTVLLMNEP